VYGAEPVSAIENELPGLCAYYAGLMAAARSSLSRRDAAAVIRNLKAEKIAAVRNAKNRRRAQRCNLRL